jgi:uncharacterized protein YcfL
MKKMFVLPVALIALMVTACGPSHEEVAAQEKAIADSTAAYDAQVQAEAEAAAAEVAAETARLAQVAADSLAKISAEVAPAK